MDEKAEGDESSRFGTRRGLHRDKAGIVISMEAWAKLLEDDAYRVIAKTKVGETEISTVWFGLEPLPFETMTFPDHKLCERYASEEEARAGHAAVVAEFMLLGSVAS